MTYKTIWTATEEPPLGTGTRQTTGRDGVVVETVLLDRNLSKPGAAPTYKLTVVFRYLDFASLE